MKVQTAKTARSARRSLVLCALAGVLGAACARLPDDADRAQPVSLLAVYSDPVGHSASDLWAFGRQGTLDLRHWDGSSWQTVALHGGPALPERADSVELASAGAGAAWVVTSGPLTVYRVSASGAAEDFTGDFASPSGYAVPQIVGPEGAPFVAFYDSYNRTSALYRWDGARFVAVAAPPEGVVVRALMFSATDAWAATNDSPRAMYHFDGTTWTQRGVAPSGATAWSASDPGHFWSIAAGSTQSQSQSVQVVHYGDNGFTVVTALAPIADVPGVRSFRAVGAQGLPGDRVAIVGVVTSVPASTERQDVVYFTLAPGEDLSPRRVLHSHIEAAFPTLGTSPRTITTELLAPLGDGTLVFTTRASADFAYFTRRDDL